MLKAVGSRPSCTTMRKVDQLKRARSRGICRRDASTDGSQDNGIAPGDTPDMTTGKDGLNDRPDRIDRYIVDH